MMVIAIAAQRTRIDTIVVTQSVTVERTGVERDERKYGEIHLPLIYYTYTYLIDAKK